MLLRLADALRYAMLIMLMLLRYCCLYRNITLLLYITLIFRHIDTPALLPLRAFTPCRHAAAADISRHYAMLMPAIFSRHYFIIIAAILLR